MDKHDAQQLLEQANSLTSKVATFSPSWLAYIFYCAAGAVYSVGRPGASAEESMLIMGGSIAWVIVGMVFIPLAVSHSTPTRRGFTKRWGIAMFVWAIPWAATMIVGPQLTEAQGVALSFVYMALAAIGPMWELTALRRNAK
ncbi:hypothetical protein QP027_08960 [Corynebacterium breve]|uniref:SPW repeat-containing protein n=1 Tax=Corynebacterium breve TaxID=3049799 RepID=A0ABY8VD36_9CORY|nr:hypothetical protein [Corynebacterium breve]WIM67242.1 hypothetical protein QP027_08960 [Corynebacterium breve]